MDLRKVIVEIFLLITIETLTIAFNNNNTYINNKNNVFEVEKFDNKTIVPESKIDKLNEVFNGVYTDCVVKFSYSCIQKKTLLYLDELNSMSEVSVLGDYVKFVKLNTTVHEKSDNLTSTTEADSKELELLINRAIDKFFKSHKITFNALGNDITVPREVDQFVGRKKKKGDHGGEDGGKKKMMMMAMMCMKMKLMMMVPAMMGMMGMVSFKGMIFSMMSFMLSKMMLLMKLLEKKGGAGFGGGATGGDGGWAASGGGGGAWMPAGGQDFAGGGYDANAQWQSRSIFEKLETKSKEPIITYVIPAVRYGNKDKKLTIGEVRSNNDYDKLKRQKRAAGNELKSYNRKNFETNEGDYESTIKTINDNDSIRHITNKTFVNNSTKLCAILSEIYKQYLLANTKSKEINVPFNNTEIYINNTRLQAINIKVNKTFTEDNGDVSKKTKSRTKRGILDILQDSYVYWMNKLLGSIGNTRRAHTNPKYKIVNGLKYVYYPIRPVLKPKAPKENPTIKIKTVDEGFKPVIAAEDFNKGEILDAAESRMNRKKFIKMKNTVNDTMDDNPWE